MIRPIGLALALAGCNSLLGIHDLPGDTPEGVAGDVTGTWQVAHIVGFGTTFVGVNLAAYEISAELADPAAPSGVRSIPAVVTGAGAFTIPEVPAGVYSLRVRALAGDRAIRYYATRSHQLDLGYETVGRPDPGDVAGSTPLAVDGFGSVTTLSSDFTGIYAPDAGSQIVLGAAGTTPNKGIHAVYDWRLAQDFSDDASQIPNRLANEQITVIHYRYNTAAGTPVIVESGGRSGFSLTPGGPTALDIGISSSPPPVTVTTQGQISNFAIGFAPYVAHRVDFEVMAYFDPSEGTAVHDTGSPLEGAVPIVDGPPLFDRRFGPNDGDLAAALPYSNPFASTASVVDRYVAVRRRLMLPHATAALEVLEGKTDRRALASQLGLTPQVLPPSHVMLDGSDPVDGVRPVPSQPVVLQWARVAGATYYDVAVEHLVVEATSPRRIELARLRTADPSVAIPASLLAGGERYEFRIASVVTPTAYADGTLRRTANPSGTAEIVTGVILFSATCGNGKVDPGEDCDTGGASATCDVDCTLPVCGDGLVNTAAGEACDAADGWCTPACAAPVCGDRFVDENNYEQCDDGNRIDGDGCSSSCRFEQHCGDGVKNAYEQCDDGNLVNTDGCRNDCTLPRCGDTVVDSALGETCDDGNLIGGDGCSATCHVEPPPT